MSTANSQSPAQPPVIKLADLVAGRTAPASGYVMSDEERHEIEHSLHHYDDNRAASIDALKTVQKKHGWVPDEAIAPIAAILGIPAADVEGVATFYSGIYRRPVGRHVIKVCDSISCYLTGFEQVMEAIKAQLRINPGQTTADNRYTLLPICCLGACDRGPVMMINDDTHRDLTPEGIPALLESYK